MDFFNSYLQTAQAQAKTAALSAQKSAKGFAQQMQEHTKVLAEHVTENTKILAEQVCLTMAPPFTTVCLWSRFLCKAYCVWSVLLRCISCLCTGVNALQRSSGVCPAQAALPGWLQAAGALAGQGSRASAACSSRPGHVWRDR